MSMIWKFKYALVLWHAGIDWRTAWYCAGVGFDENREGLSAHEAAEIELSYWTENA